MDLPNRLGISPRIALGGEDAPLSELRAAGWEIVDGPRATSTPELYRQFVRASAGKISVAKDVYVALRTGWFSTRSACYLAAARPVVVQDTGFSAIIPTGEGLFAFSDVEQAVSAVRAVEGDRRRHEQAARELASSYFDSGSVLGRLLDDVFAPRPPRPDASLPRRDENDTLRTGRRSAA